MTELHPSVYLQRVLNVQQKWHRGVVKDVFMGNHLKYDDIKSSLTVGSSTYKNDFAVYGVKQDKSLQVEIKLSATKTHQESEL